MEKNIREEIKRIKTLFTEERLYGNLVEATNPDANEDGVIDATEFAASGNEIDRVEAELFLTSSSKPNANLVDYCLRPGSTLTVVKDIVEPKLDGGTKTKINSSGTNCFWEMRNPNTAIITAPQVNMAYILDEYRLGFFVKLSPEIDLGSLSGNLKTMEYITSRLQGVITLNKTRGKDQKVMLLKFIGELNPSQYPSVNYEDIQYRNLKFDGFYDTNYKKLSSGVDQPLFNSLEYPSSGGYKPLIGAGPSRNETYAPGVDGIINELGISPVSGKLQSIIDNLEIS